jgi:hypothetical protein
MTLFAPVRSLKRQGPSQVMTLPLLAAAQGIPLPQPAPRDRGPRVRGLTGAGIFPGNVHHLLWSASRGTELMAKALGKK